MKVREQDGITIVTIVPKFDAFAPRRDQPELLALVEKGARRIVCDFSGTSFVSSSGLRVILALSQALASVQGQVVLYGLQEQVARIFAIAGFDQAIPTVATLDEALARLRPPARS